MMGMAECMSKLPRFSVHVRNNYDAYQTTGQKIEVGATPEVLAAFCRDAGPQSSRRLGQVRHLTHERSYR